ncbi:hypothetical protein NEMIN01_2123 [Nematocida minor]|uniref:uncharacterized protein n=1 Tax=Nematocida minor TaxID=1912983 RepID=UPI0022200E98|nr:uncharacterized protein NEMIN01_2123 [Nematocida minor]KAI5192635.1 hypothetical protein NEMIN01_2123 [Nematocida minor]
MFYAVNVLSSKGRLSAAWVAAYFDRRLSKHDIQQVSIEETVKSIETGEVPELALRTSSHILLGLSKILFRKTKILYDECKELFITVKRKSPVDPQQSQKISKTEITYPISLFKYVNLPAHYATANAEVSEVEIGRGTVDGMISNLEYSISLNNISLTLAETLSDIHSTEESEIVVNNTMEEHTISEIKMQEDEMLPNISAISHYEPSHMADTLLKIPEKETARKRTVESHEKVKKVKYENSTEVENKNIKPAKMQPVKIRSHLIPEKLRDIYTLIQSTPVEEKENKTQEQSIANISSVSQAVNSRSSFNESFNESFNHIESTSIEIPRRESVLAIPADEPSFLLMNNADLDGIMSEGSSSIDLESSDIRKKTQSFIHMLRKISEGTLRAVQPVPYGSIAVEVI